MSQFDNRMKTKASSIHFNEFWKCAMGEATPAFSPYDWQTLLAKDGFPPVLPVPTGLGKTEGAALAWAWRLATGLDEPRHLVYCLPMRSLVTQTVVRLRAYFDALKDNTDLEVKVHQLMGGSLDEDWVRWPDTPWVLVGTQDQLLSRALNRGYAMSRFSWPVHFGLLNNDCRWIIDEVQLMGPGLWTTAQLDWMRRMRFPSLKPCLTTWMSATVGTSFLCTTDRARDGFAEPSTEQVAFESKLKASLDSDPSLSWWREAKRPVNWTKANSAAAIATAVTKEHKAGTLSLVVCNTVDLARDVFRALSMTHKVLVTSRFRREDRNQHERRLLAFDANQKAGKLPEDDPGLICVSTQVIEAGVDLSAHRLWSELAPWSSVLQRLGRLNRKGADQDACAWFWETPTEKGRNKTERIGPYESADIARAKKLLDEFAPNSRTETFSQAIAVLSRQREKDVWEALQPKASPLPRALDVYGLFSTERDLHGGFTDVGAFVRGTDPDLDVSVFWRDWSGDSPPRGEELDGPSIDPAGESCPVPFIRLGEMLKARGVSGWLWDDEAERWERVHHRDVRPGMLIMLKRDVGGYDSDQGWTGDKESVLDDVPRAGRGASLREDSRTEIGYWSRIEDHLRDARREAEQMCHALDLVGDLCRAVVEGAGLHDLGKAHPQWQNALPDRSGIPGVPLAKSPRVVVVEMVGEADAIGRRVQELRQEAIPLPDEARRRGREQIARLRWAVDKGLHADEVKSLREFTGVRWVGHAQFRPGLRHEAASALAMWRRYREGSAPFPALAVYLAATHHGKVRTVLRSTAGEGDDVFGVPRESDALLLGSESWPLDFSIAKDGAEGRWEGNEFVLTAHGWTGLVADLLGPWRPEEKSDAGVVPSSEPRHLGPFALAYLEALVRIADWRASERPSVSIKPSEVHRDS